MRGFPEETLRFRLRPTSWEDARSKADPHDLSFDDLIPTSSPGERERERKRDCGDGFPKWLAYFFLGFLPGLRLVIEFRWPTHGGEGGREGGYPSSRGDASNEPSGHYMCLSATWFVPSFPTFPVTFHIRRDGRIRAISKTTSRDGVPRILSGGFRWKIDR